MFAILSMSLLPRSYVRFWDSFIQSISGYDFKRELQPFRQPWQRYSPFSSSAPKGLSGCLIKFPKISVGATQNILIASCFSKGKTKLRNCAIEPEVKDLIIFLKKLGCKINIVGKRSFDIYGVKKLKSVLHKVIFDRIEAGTYIIAAAITNGSVKIKNIDSKIKDIMLSLDLNKSDFKVDEIYPDVFLIEKK